MLHSSSTAVDSLFETLTPRRREVVELVARGLTNEDIAGVLSLSPNTVRIHLTSIFAHLQVTNRTEAAAALLTWKAGSARVTELLARPALVVLPMAALDADAGATTRATGITHDLTLLFSRWCWFPVIAGPATRDAAETPTQAGRRLGARFVVDGALRTGPSWRLNVRLHDVETGYCLWSERYDFPGTSLFQVQDAVCETIVATSYEVLVQGLRAGARTAAPPEDLQAWELAHHGMVLHAARDRRSNEQGRARFLSAIEREPELMLAHFGLGLCHYDEVLNQWTGGESAADRLATCAQRCIDLAPQAGEGYFLLGRHHQALGRHAEAVQPLKEAISHNPSMAGAHALLAQVLALSGELDEGLTRMQHAQRLAPRAFVAGLAVVHFLRNENAVALGHAERALATNPGYAFARVIAVASAWWMGETARAAEHGGRLRQLHPDFSSARFLSTFGSVFGGVARIAQALDAVGIGR